MSKMSDEDARLQELGVNPATACVTVMPHSTTPVVLVIGSWGYTLVGGVLHHRYIAHTFPSAFPEVDWRPLEYKGGELRNVAQFVLIKSALEAAERAQE